MSHRSIKKAFDLVNSMQINDWVIVLSLLICKQID